MKKHLKKYERIYQIIGIVLCLGLSLILIYLGKQHKKENAYTEEEVMGIMKLKADQLTRMLEITNDGTCKEVSPSTLTENEMEKYGFDQKFYQAITYKITCENEKEIVTVTIIGTGDFKGYKLKNYISNKNE